MINKIIEFPDGKLECSCGAKAELSERNRFRKRHPAKCQVVLQKREENIQATREIHSRNHVMGDLLVGTVQKDVVEIVINYLREDPRRLSSWEKDFILDISEQWKEKEWISEKQFEILNKIARGKIS